jgi:hypothetical protein
LKLENGKTVIGVETISRFIYKEETKKLFLWEYLPLKRKRR